MIDNPLPNQVMQEKETLYHLNNLNIVLKNLLKKVYFVKDNL